MKIDKNTIVTTIYKLYVGEGSERELMEETTVETPLVFAYGVNMMLPEFERQLAGLTVGDKYSFTIACADAYGEYDEENFRDLPMEVFVGEDGKLDEKIVFKGNIVPLITSDGQHINAQVVEVKKDAVTMDFNHPLAGEDLRFEGEIIGIREATEADLAALQGGCGCGCHDCNCDDDCDCGEHDGCHCGHCH